MTRQVCGPIAGLLNFFEVTLNRILWVDSLQRETSVPIDRGQQVVEVVGDAAGKLSNSFHLLRLAQLIFELLSFGDVARYALDAGCHAVLINILRVDLDGNAASVFSDNFDVISGYPFSGQFAFHHLLDLRQALRRYRVAHFELESFFERIACNFFTGFIHRCVITFQVM